MRIYTTAPLEDPREARTLYAELEAIGYDGGFSFEAKHDPFLPLAVACEHTTRLQLGTAIAIAFARNPMNLANLAYDLQVLSEGRFLLGLGSQVRPHIEKRFSSSWGRPVARMREIVLAIRAIFDAWEGRAKLEHRGDYYTHTIMIPAFDPGPNPFGPPPIYTAGYGPKMVAVAGEVADGFIAHPFNSRESHQQHTLPALERGLAASGRRRADVDVIAVAMVVTADDEQEFERVKTSARNQLAFYGSTPAYRPVLDCHGWGDLHPRLNRLSKEGGWEEMARLIDDEMLETICVVGERHTIAGKLIERMEGIADGVSLTNTRCPDPTHWRAEVADFRRLVAAPPHAGGEPADPSQGPS